MKKYLVLSTVLLLASPAFAQKPGMPPPRMEQPGERMMGTRNENKPKTVYADSAQFKTEFKELFALIRPTPNVQERAEKMFTRMSRFFKTRGVDSAKAYDSIMAKIDKSKDEEIIFDAYREAFTAQELKDIITFFKTPAGKHYLEIEPKLMEASSRSIDMYVQRTMMEAVAPMEKPMERKPRPQRPGMPGEPPTPPTPPVPPAHD